VLGFSLMPGQMILLRFRVNSTQLRLEMLMSQCEILEVAYTSARTLGKN
jgi:hypothetical protein